MRFSCFGLAALLWVAGVGAAKEPFSVVSVTLDNEALNRAHDVELSADGKLAFVPGKGGSTAILDVSNPEKPEILWHLFDVEVTPDSETVMPLGDWLVLGTKHFHVLDISAPRETKILKTLSFDEGRIKTAIVLYPSIVNQEDFYEILKILPFESSRKKVMEAIRKK